MHVSREGGCEVVEEKYLVYSLLIKSISGEFLVQN